MQQVQVSLIIGALAIAVAPAHAAIVRAQTMQQLIVSADVIVMGPMVGVVDRGETVVATASGRVHGRLQSGNVVIDQMLKGSDGTKQLTVDFVVTDVFIGYPAAANGDYRMFFLKKNGDRFEFANPFYPSVPGSPGASVVRGSVADRIVGVNADVLQHRQAQAGVIREAINVLRQIDAQNAVAVTAFLSAVDDKESSVRLMAAAALVASGHLRGLSVAEDVLLGRAPAAAPYLLQSLRVSISDFLPVEASTLPVLSRLLSEGDMQTRRAVSRALRRAHSNDSRPLLFRALEDPDIEVRYNAVIAFAEASGDTEHRPSRPAFEQNPGRYVNYWNGRLGQNP